MQRAARPVDRLLLLWQIENCWFTTYGTFAAKFTAPPTIADYPDLALLFADARNPGGPHTPHLQNVIIPALPGVLISGMPLSCQT